MKLNKLFIITSLISGIAFTKGHSGTIVLRPPEMSNKSYKIGNTSYSVGYSILNRAKTLFYLRLSNSRYQDIAHYTVEELPNGRFKVTILTCRPEAVKVINAEGHPPSSILNQSIIYLHNELGEVSARNFLEPTIINPVGGRPINPPAGAAGAAGAGR